MASKNTKSRAIQEHAARDQSKDPGRSPETALPVVVDEGIMARDGISIGDLIEAPSLPGMYFRVSGPPKTENFHGLEIGDWKVVAGSGKSLGVWEVK